MDKYQELRTHETEAPNCDLDTEDIINKFKEWDQKYGIDLSDIESDSVTIHFKNLPDDLTLLAQEIYEFCPDTIDQHFGCFGDMIEILKDRGEEVSEEILELVEGVDLEDDNHGLELLQRTLKKYKLLGLWWD
jgi:hypothetical protein